MKKTKILLIQAPFWTTTTPSLALAYLTSAVKNEHRKVNQFSLDLEIAEKKESYRDIFNYANEIHKTEDYLFSIS